MFSCTFTCIQGFSSPSLKVDDVVLAIAAFAQNLIIYKMLPLQHAITNTFGGRRRLLAQTAVIWVELVKGVSCSRQLTSELDSTFPWSLPPPLSCLCNTRSCWKVKDQTKKEQNQRSRDATKRIVEWRCNGCKQRYRIQQPEWVVPARRDCSYLWIYPVPLLSLNFVQHGQR